MNIYEALALTVLISIVLGLAIGVWLLVQHIKGRTKSEQEFLKRHGFKKNENSVPEAILEATKKRRGDKC